MLYFTSWWLTIFNKNSNSVRLLKIALNLSENGHRKQHLNNKLRNFEEFFTCDKFRLNEVKIYLPVYGHHPDLFIHLISICLGGAGYSYRGQAV